jgi:hypothetical protein
MGQHCILAGFGVSLACAASVFAQGYSFTLLDSQIPGSTERAVPVAISGNGMVVAGGDTSLPGTRNEQAWVWRKTEGVWVRSALPLPPAPADVGRALSLSFDGDVIAGMAGLSSDDTVTFYGKPAIWRSVLSGAATLSMPTVPSLFRGAVAGLSSSGDRAVFWAQLSADNTAPREMWTVDAAGSLQRQLPNPAVPAGGYFAGTLVTANIMSADGNRFAFFRDGPSFELAASTAQTLPNPYIAVAPNVLVAGMSRDASTLVGYAGESLSAGNFTYAAAWRRQPDGLFVARALPVFNSSQITNRGAATAVNADGRVVGGCTYNIAPFLGFPQGTLSAVNAMLWINDAPFLLSTYLSRQGVNLQGVQPQVITGISDDGATIVGYGRRPAANLVGFEMIAFVATILPPGVCDDIDFNRDGNRFDPLDIEAFLSVFSEGPCLPAGASCRDIDFNNDGSLFDPEDVDAFLRVFSEGPCTL